MPDKTRDYATCTQRAINVQSERQGEQDEGMDGWWPKGIRSHFMRELLLITMSPPVKARRFSDSKLDKRVALMTVFAINASASVRDNSICLCGNKSLHPICGIISATDMRPLLQEEARDSL